jgi:hypothetical protein
MVNINNQVWNYIEHHAAIKKNLLVGLINTSALARKIAQELDLIDSIDAVISGIRRFDGKVKNKDVNKVKKIMHDSKVSTKSGLTSLLIVRNIETERKSSELHTKLKLTRNSTLRTFEATNHISIIIDKEFFEDTKKLFSAKEIVCYEKSIGEVSLVFNEDISKVSSVTSTVLQEFAIHDVRILDSLIGHWEMIFILGERELNSASNVLMELTN